MQAKKKVIAWLNFLVTGIACSFFQCLVLLVLVGIQFMLWFGFGQLIWHVFSDAQLGLAMAPIISWTIVFGTYALIWFLFWWLLFKESIRWFYWKVAFSTLPLICALFMFNPKPDPMVMIPLSITEVKFQFSAIVTGIVFFPIYSISIYKFVLLKQLTPRMRNTVYVIFTMIFVGSLLFLISWNVMPLVY